MSSLPENDLTPLVKNSSWSSLRCKYKNTHTESVEARYGAHACAYIHMNTDWQSIEQKPSLFLSLVAALACTCIKHTHTHTHTHTLSTPLAARPIFLKLAGEGLCSPRAANVLRAMGSPPHTHTHTLTHKTLAQWSRRSTLSNPTVYPSKDFLFLSVFVPLLSPLSSSLCL